ncbi:hypothetical protein IGI04_022903 [Brassica rapa subsp. trilocularis]|uniref:Proline-rich protein n=1 Tax=Brassica rapa subsp. trilocularis TaxID=1813537 RepID=A0ABQ7M297_BRACM|nr:hypothetical protein IGI04_022903 [Brassica rapa subsp. trilocularis]
MKLVIFISLLLVFPLCSSGFEKDDEVTQVSQHLLDKVVDNLMDYGYLLPPPPRSPRPPHASPTDPPPPPPPHPPKNDILQ